MKRYLIALLVVLLGVFCMSLPAYASGFVKWADSTYKHYMYDSTFYWSKYDTTYTDVNTGDTLLHYVAADTLWTLPIGWIGIAVTDTTYNYCHTGDSIIITADTTIVLDDTMFVVADTTILTAGDLVRRIVEWTRIEGTTDSLISEPFNVLGIYDPADVIIATTGYNHCVLQAEITDTTYVGGTDSACVSVSLLLSSYPLCRTQAATTYSYTHGTMTKATATATSLGIGDMVLINMEAPAQCGRLVVIGVDSNAVATPGADYGSGTSNGTLLRAWILAE